MHFARYNQGKTKLSTWLVALLTMPENWHGKVKLRLQVSYLFIKILQLVNHNYHVFRMNKKKPYRS